MEMKKGNHSKKTAPDAVPVNFYNMSYQQLAALYHVPAVFVEMKWRK